MRKVLMAATAIAGAAALSVGAPAGEAKADGFQLTIGGFYNALVVVRDQDNPRRTVTTTTNVDLGEATGDPALDGVTGQITTTESRKRNIRNYDFNHRARYRISGEVTTDGGITVGFQSQHEVQQGLDTNRAYVYAGGSFGRIQFGNMYAASYLLTGFAPSAGWAIDDTGHSHAFSSINGLGFPTTKTYLINRSMNITYMTPRFSGFQAGVTFAPDNTRNQNDPGRFVTDKDELGSGDLKNMVGVGANYSQSFDDFGLSLSAAWETGERAGSTSGGKGPEGAKSRAHTATVYGEASFSGLTAGLGYRWANGPAGTFGHLPFSGARHHNVVGGLTYTTGPWTVGPSVGYQWEKGSNTLKRKLLLGEFGVTYAFAPGVNLVSSIEYARYRGGRGEAETGEGIAGLFGVQLSF